MLVEILFSFDVCLCAAVRSVTPADTFSKMVKAANFK